MRLECSLPFADLELISFAATPGGLCQLLSNPLTCFDTFRHILNLQCITRILVGMKKIP